MKRFLEKILFCDFFTGSVALGVASLVLLFAMACNVHAAETKGKSIAINRYVFAVSANNGGKGRPQLRYAESDARAFANVLVQMGGVSRQNLYMVTEPSAATLQERLAALDKKLLAAKSGKPGGESAREEVLVYYSGHADEKGLRLGNEVYSWKEFRSRIDGLHADVKIAVIDACGSGAITRVKGGVAVPAFMVDQSSDMKGYAFITSSTQDESSQESDKLKGSFFTHSLVSGLRGAGDVSGDGKVTLSEAYQFAFNETLQKTETTMGGAQHPSRDMNLAGTGDVVMTDLRSTSAGLELDEDVDGHLFIRDEKGELVAELFKKPGRAMSLGFPAGRYSVRLERPAEFKEASVTLQDNYRARLSNKQFKAVTAEKTTLRGEIGGNRSCADGDTVKCSLDSLDHHGTSRTTFNAYDHEKEPRKGLQIGVFATKTDDYMLGSQLSLFVNSADKEIHGMQLAGLVNLSDEKIEGAQISGLVNYAGSFDGLQLGTFNWSNRKSSGAQLGYVNVGLDTVSALQLGFVNYSFYSKVHVGFVNVAAEAGVQVGFVDVAYDDEGSVQVGYVDVAAKSDLQVGFVNTAYEEGGVQVGFVNVADHAKERQWGFVNVCVECDRSPIGFINVVGNGVWTLTGSFNEMGGTGLKADLGTAYWYTSIETSRNFKRDRLFDEYDNLFENGIGFGTHFGQYGSHFALEYMLLNVTEKYSGQYGILMDKSHHAALHHRIRLGSTIKLFPGVGLTGGLSLNLLTEGYSDDLPLKPLGSYHDDLGSGHHRGRFWPGFYSGITVGRF